jgi:AAA+ superfamily predicted ATPase
MSYHEDATPSSMRNGTTVSLHDPSSALEELLLTIVPQRLLATLILPSRVAQACRELIEEHQRADRLRAGNKEPRHRLMLVGPPGNGKTSLAEAVATELSLPLLVVRYAAVLLPPLDAAAARLQRIFDYAAQQHCVLFLDEFDTIGTEREQALERGDITRVVSSLLLQIDATSSHVIVVAATNHPENLDRAAWRRFQLRLELPSPSRDEVLRWCERLAQRLDFPATVSLPKLASQLTRLSFAELESFSDDIERRLLLADPPIDVGQIVRERLDQWTRRAEPLFLPSRL